jgi:hypothetical protein
MGTSVSPCKEAARTSYQHSTDKIVVLTTELGSATAATAAAQAKYDAASATADKVGQRTSL